MAGPEFPFKVEPKDYVVFEGRIGFKRGLVLLVFGLEGTYGCFCFYSAAKAKFWPFALCVIAIMFFKHVSRLWFYITCVGNLLLSKCVVKTSLLVPTTLLLDTTHTVVKHNFYLFMY